MYIILCIYSYYIAVLLIYISPHYTSTFLFFQKIYEENSRIQNYVIYMKITAICILVQYVYFTSFLISHFAFCIIVYIENQITSFPDFFPLLQHVETCGKKCKSFLGITISVFERKKKILRQKATTASYLKEN